MYSTHTLCELTQSDDFLLHLAIREFVIVVFADFANTKSMGKSCALLTKNTTYGDQIWMMPLISSANQSISSVAAHYFGVILLIQSLWGKSIFDHA